MSERYAITLPLDILAAEGEVLKYYCKAARELLEGKCGSLIIPNIVGYDLELIQDE